MTARPPPPRLGLGPNRGQFALLVVVNAFVGAMVGIERTVLPLVAERDFGIASTVAVLSFLSAFGLAKATTNLAAGRLADQWGRRRLLVAGWVAALPVAPMIIWAPSWEWIVAANVLLGLNQGLAWSMTVVMKVDLAGPERRGFAVGINEAAGYAAVAVMAGVTGAMAGAFGHRTAPFALGIGIALIGLVLSWRYVRETEHHVAAEAAIGNATRPRFADVFARTSFTDRTTSAACQAGLVTNLNDGLAWGLLPLYLAAEGLSVGRIGIVLAAYPAVWGVGQLATGAWSDTMGRRPLIVSGMWLQAAGIAAILVADGFAGWLIAAVAMGAGTALVYPTLLAAVGDAAHPTWRASALGVYRLWRDLGFVAGALLAGVVADLAGMGVAIGLVAAVTAWSGAVVAARMPERKYVPEERSWSERRELAC